MTQKVSVPFKLKSINVWQVVCLFSLFFLLFSEVSMAQKKEKEDDHKSKKTVVEDGKKFYLHTVDKKQTLFAIAKIYNLSVNDIVLENPDAIDGIKPGTVLKIPFEKPKAKAKETVKKPAEEKTKQKENGKPQEVMASDTSQYVYDTIEKGKTLYSLSKQYAVSVERIKQLNPESADGLKIGQVLRFPSDNKKVAGGKKEVTKEKQKEKEKTLVVKNEKTPVVNPIVPPAETKPKVTKDTTIATVYKSELKSEYNIAFFLPFHADEAMAMDMDKLIRGDDELPNKTSIALSFYEGALIAIDSLKKQKLNAKIFVYDIDDKDSMNIEKILKKPELLKMDLMIGPLYGSSFTPFSKFAKEHSIPIVSPFIQANKILFSNAYVCKALPSNTLQVEHVAHYVIDSFSTQNVILVDNGRIREASFVGAFKTTANADLKSRGINDTVKQAKGISGVEGMLSSSKTNVVVLPSVDQSYVTEFVRSLRSKREKFKVVLFGLQNWTTFDNLDIEYLNDLSLHISSNSFVDYDNAATKMMINKYRVKYKTEPDMYVYQGFDVSYYFISELQKQGTGFLKNISEGNYKGVQTNYNFKQHPSDSGFENNFVHILKYQDYKLVKAQ